LRSFRQHWRSAEPRWHNAPVPSFGGGDARLLIVGLAPGLRGANRTGRPFTGDGAGELLFPTLIAAGFASGSYERRAHDRLTLRDCRISNAVRCVPPANRPTPEEIHTCNRFLVAELAALPQLRVVLALGTVAHRAVLTACGLKAAAAPFVHGTRHALPARLDGGARFLVDSYHCSRLNTNTGRLSAEMFRAVFADIRSLIEG
jgi:uracil-DNA glycosylase family 4